MSGVEVIGAVTAVSSLVELSAKILIRGYSYIKDVVDAPIQLHQLLSEVSSLGTLLNEINELAVDAENSKGSALSNALTKTATKEKILDCQKLFEEVEVKVSRCERKEGHTLGNLGRRLKWPFDSKETAELMQQLQRLKSYFQDAIMIDMARKVDSIVERQAKTQLAEEFDNLITWICPTNTDVSTNLNDAQRARYPDTCQWLLDSVKYIEWKKSQSRKILWINGPAGSGKTVMSAMIIQNLRETSQTPKDAVLYFYLKHEDASKQSLTAILSQAIRQLLDIQPECIHTIKDMKKDASGLHGEKEATTKDQINILKGISRQHFENIFLVIDALDEGATTDEVLNIVVGLSNLLQSNKTDQSPAPISVICTSRRLAYIQQKLDQINCVDIDIDPNIHPEVSQDIRTYIVVRIKAMISKISSSGANVSSMADLEHQAIETVAAKADGLFLQARYHLDYLSEAPNIKRFRKKLSDLPDGLADTYNLILSQIRQKHSRYMDEVSRMLRWIAGVREPTTVSALAQVAVIEPDDTCFDSEAAWPDVDELLMMLSSLITVDNDHGTSLVRFSHFTVREHLSSSQILNSSEKAFYIDPETLDKELARITLQYLSFDQFAKPDPVYASEYICHFTSRMRRDASTYFMHVRVQDRLRCQHRIRTLRDRSKSDFKKKLDDYPLLAYASEFWFEHLRDSRMTLGELYTLIPNLEEWFSDSEGQDPRFLNWVEVHSSGCMRADHCDMKQPPLYFALLLGILPWVQALATDTNLPSSAWHSQFNGGWNTMTLAAASLSTRVVDEVLLHAGSDKIDDPASTRFKKKLNALHVAAELGDSRMIKHLLTRGASPWPLTRSGTTSLYRAAGSGSMRGFELIYTSVKPDRRVEYIDVQTWDNWTALMNAVLHRRLEVVEFLLEHGADWSVTNRSGHTALTMSIQLRSPSIQQVIVQKVASDANKKLGKDYILDALDYARSVSGPAEQIERWWQESTSTDQPTSEPSSTPKTPTATELSDKRSQPPADSNNDNKDVSSGSGDMRSQTNVEEIAERCKSLMNSGKDVPSTHEQTRSESPSTSIQDHDTQKPNGR